MGRHTVPVTRLLDYIETRILSGEYPPGTMLPSVRRMAAKFKLSYGTAYRAFTSLCESGVLEQRSNLGFFVTSRRRPGGERRIKVFMELAVQPDVSMMYHALLGARDLAEAHNFQLELMPAHCSSVTVETFREASEDCEGMLLLSAYDWYISRFETRVPTVGVLMLNSYHGLISTVNIDLFDAIRWAVDYFMSQATDEIKVFSSPKPIYRQRARMFLNSWRDIGGKGEFIDSDMPQDYDFKAGYGYFFTSDDWLNTASRAYFARTGMRLEQAFPTLGIDGKHAVNPDFPPFPTIGVDWRLIGRTAMEELLRRIAQPEAPARNLTICGQLELPEQLPF